MLIIIWIITSNLGEITKKDDFSDFQILSDEILKSPMNRNPNNT